MKKTAPTLNRSVSKALLAFVLLTTLASACLVTITSLVHDTTEVLSNSVASIGLAKDAQHDLALTSRATDDVARIEAANELRLRMYEAEHYVSSPEERRIFKVAENRVGAYLNAVGPLKEHLEPAVYDALSDLTRINLVQAADAQSQASRLDLLGNVVGVATALIVVAAALALGAWVRAHTVEPVLGLARTMHEFGRGDETQRAKLEGPEELREMARQFNEMADRLAEQKASQRTYLAAVAHDLRNPLGTLRLAVDTFSREAVTDPSRLQRMISIVRRQIDRLTRLAGDLLDTANFEAGHLDLVVEAHDLCDVARSTVDFFSTASSRHRIELSLPDEAVVIACDSQRIDQVLANLIGNAIKYSPDGGAVHVRIDLEGDMVSLSVEDHGVGMSAEEIARAFKPFVRSATMRERVPGYGLGLFIVKRIVEAHGGAMSIESTPGQGSIFRVTLPFERRRSLEASSTPVPALH